MPNLNGDQDDREEHEDEGPFADFEPSPIPVAPDGGIQPGYGVGPPEPELPMDAEHCICLRGPCRHYWEMAGPVVAGNPEGTWAHLGIEAPNEYHRTCIAGPDETELKGFAPTKCNLWDPMDPSMFREREYRRKKWLEENEPEPEVVEDETPAD